MYRSLRLLSIFLFSLGSFTDLSAQNPGYMGKRAVVGYGLYLNPGFGNILNNYSDRYINRQHELFIEYAVSKKCALGVSVRLYNYTYNNTERVYIVNGISSYNSGIKQETDNPVGSYDIRARSYSFTCKLFRYGYLAPWGKYFLMGLTLHHYETNYDPETMYVNGYSTANNFQIKSDFGPTQQSFMGGDFYFGNGNSRIFWNHLVFDYGYTIGLVSTFQMFINALDLYDELSPERYIEATSVRRVAALNRFNFYFKVGYLF